MNHERLRPSVELADPIPRLDGWECVLGSSSRYFRTLTSTSYAAPASRRPHRSQSRRIMSANAGMTGSLGRVQDAKRPGEWGLLREEGGNLEGSDFLSGFRRHHRGRTANESIVQPLLSVFRATTVRRQRRHGSPRTPGADLGLPSLWRVVAVRDAIGPTYFCRDPVRQRGEALFGLREAAWFRNGDLFFAPMKVRHRLGLRAP